MRFLRHVWYLVSGRRRDSDLANELAFHREMKLQELRDRGVGEADVVAIGQRELGNDLLARERSRDVWVPPAWQDIGHDVRFGLRMLAKDRRFTGVAIVALGLGITVNSSVFTVMNTALFRPLPFPDPHRLVAPWLFDKQGRNAFLSYADYVDWVASLKSIEMLTANQSGTMNLSEDGRAAERMRGTFVTANTFAMLRVPPFIGRDFTADDDRAGASPVVILGYDVWHSRYGGEANVIGRTVRVNSVPATVIGVMPPRFGYPGIAQMWQPLSMLPNVNPANRGLRNLSVAGRLAQGHDVSQAQVELDTLLAQLAKAYPTTNAGFRVRVQTLQDAQSGGEQGRVTFATLMGAVTFVLLIACANVASLLLARSTHRSARDRHPRLARGILVAHRPTAADRVCIDRSRRGTARPRLVALRRSDDGHRLQCL
jgi:predicted permease